MGASEDLHETADALGLDAIDRHRAIASLREELDAVDWYDQRARAATDRELIRLLEHNRDEEKEHAAMLLEWLRRRDARLGEQLSKYVFTDTPLTDAGDDAGGDGNTGSLSIGGLKGVQ